MSQAPPGSIPHDEHFASLAMFMKVSALVGDRGFNFEYANGVLKVNVFPASKANPPPDKGSWRRSGAAPATTKAPYKHPRAAKHKAAGAKPVLPSATLHSPDCQSKERHQPGAADATENSDAIVPRGVILQAVRRHASLIRKN